MLVGQCLKFVHHSWGVLYPSRSAKARALFNLTNKIACYEMQSMNFKTKTTLVHVIASLGFALLLIDGQLPLPAAWLLAINVVTFFTMGKDKLSAQKKWRRTPEVTLQILSALGGWGGMYLGQKTFRHKTIKAAFRTTLFWVFVAEVTALTALTYYLYF